MHVTRVKMRTFFPIKFKVYLYFNCNFIKKYINPILTLLHNKHKENRETHNVKFLNFMFLTAAFFEAIHVK